MSRPDPSTFKVHLHSLDEPGDRFRLTEEPGAIVYEVVELPPSKEGEAPRLAYRSQAGEVLTAAAIAELNGKESMFVHQVPSLNPKGTS